MPLIRNSTLDPRTKLIMVMSISTLAIVINDLFFMLGILAICICLNILLKVELRSIFKKLKRLIKVLLILVVVQSIFIKGGEAIIQIGRYTLISDVGLFKACAFLLRISIIVSSAALLTTSSYREIVQGFVQWKMPYEIAFMVSVAIRFLPTFTEEFKDAIVALQLRGIEIEKVAWRKKVKVYAYLLFPVISNAIVKAQELSVAMETRAFRAYPNRTSYLVLRMQAKDYIISTFTLASMMGILVLYYIR